MQQIHLIGDLYVCRGQQSKSTVLLDRVRTISAMSAYLWKKDSKLIPLIVFLKDISLGAPV